MRFTDNVKIRDVAGEHIIMSVSHNAADLTKVMSLNDSSLLIYNTLKGGDFELEDVVRVMLDTYEVDEATARHDAQQWIEKMREHNLIA